ncbi:solute carrier family 13 member 3-like [Xenopus laevis]|uniref:Solute carrier family 13 member 3-like n=1 Tax=Xenopus laevis TaxID=8355 RepID=A0A8J0TRP5_XENLA|nr:solute carrier family 13 member 3-like [Xenopus laevis]
MNAHMTGSSVVTCTYSDRKSLQQRAKTGLVMNVMGVLLLSLAMNTWASSIFQLGTFPDWVPSHDHNGTNLISGAQNTTAGR